MKYNYWVESLDIGGKKRFVFRLPDELKAVEIFFNSDIQSEHMSNKVKDECIQVQRGIVGEISFNSNSCSVTIKSDYVHIKDRYAEDNNAFSIETSELVLLIEAFAMEKKKSII